MTLVKVYFHCKHCSINCTKQHLGMCNICMNYEFTWNDLEST